MGQSAVAKIERPAGNNGGRREISPEEIGAVIDADAADKYRRLTRAMEGIKEALKKETSGERREKLEREYDGLKVRRGGIEEAYYRFL